MYDDIDDVEEADEILEIRLPPNMALMLDYTQHSYFQMQAYFEGQWEHMQRLLAMDEPDYKSTISGDEIMFQKQFDAIVKDIELDTDKDEE